MWHRVEQKLSTSLNTQQSQMLTGAMEQPSVVYYRTGIIKEKMY